MPCIRFPEGGFICTATCRRREIRVFACPTCGTRRRMLMEYYEWYDPRITCLTCGESWEGEERMERPVERGWRARVVAEARERAKGLGLR